MPPKPKKSEPSKKTEQKKKDRVIEDKTFGLKNKKGAKQQKFIDHVAKQVQCGGKSGREVQKAVDDKLTKKELKKQEQDELNSLFRPVEQKVLKGADPKSMLCAFFKQGLCSKGAKCKFSHDLALARKGEKRSLYDDVPEKETMDDWDEIKLEDVINKKHGEQNKSLPKTTIICKYFLDGVESGKYGWFWSCPNGASCHYRHALPAGFVLKKDKRKMDEQKEPEISLEELIEKERAALSSKTFTKVTLENFLRWKERKRREKIDKIKQESDKKKQDYKAGRTVGISGRQMFEFNPELLLGDADLEDGVAFRTEDADNEDEYSNMKEIDLADLQSAAQENDGTGTISTGAQRTGDTSSLTVVNGVAEANGEENKLDMAAALPVNGSADAAAAVTFDEDLFTGDADIDENLFDGEDLDLVEEELENLEMDD